MRDLLSFFSLILLLSWGAVSTAEGPAAIEPDRVVGSVLGESVTAADIGLTDAIDTSVVFDARDKERWQLMGRITQAFGKPIVDRFVENRKIEVSATEIMAFSKRAKQRNDKQLEQDNSELAKVKEQLTATNLADSDRVKLQQDQQDLESRIKVLKGTVPRGALEAMARTLLMPRKIERELHRVYGGRAIFQQFGPEALDARRQLYEEAEQKGELTFTDPGVRHLFYYYSNMRHTFVDEETLKKAWF